MKVPGRARHFSAVPDSVAAPVGASGAVPVGASGAVSVAASIAASFALAGQVAARGAVPPAVPDATNLLLGWEFEPFVILSLVIVAVAWWRLLGSIDRAHPERPVARRQRWLFVVGLLVVAIALQSGVARYDTTLFSLHMVQHLLLTLVAPPLLALAAPITQILRAASPETRQHWILPILHSRVVTLIGHPIVAWLAFTAVMWGTHFSPLFNQSLEDPLVHDLEHGLYLAVGLLFWWPVVGLDPAPRRMSHPARIAYLFLQMPQNSFLAMAILFANGPLYAHYATLGAPYGIDALSDQRSAAGIMWFVGDVIFLIATLAVLAGWMRNEARTTNAADRRADDERAAIRQREAELRRRRAAERADQSGAGVSSSDR
ncbi:MAG: cytochrome c oxidase assembly protein [Chloroflexi bacterium]|nr:cytochrome c oxidase assembly protein [Chloroflexota bacterium]